MIKRNGMEDQHWDFLHKIETQLAAMPEREKDLWILAQAKVLSADQFQDFLKSLTGEKKIQSMPDDSKIEEFCKKVSSGEIQLEYETHYVEFDSSGGYYDEWDSWYHDPYGAMNFLDCVFKGCHNLIALGEYTQADKILRSVSQLEFTVIEAPDSDDFDSDINPCSLADVYGEGLLTTNQKQVAYDLLYAFYIAHRDQDPQKLAQGLVELCMLPLCESILPSDVFNDREQQRLLCEMIMILNAQILKQEDTVIGIDFGQHPLERYYMMKQLNRRQIMVNDLKAILNQEAS